MFSPSLVSMIYHSLPPEVLPPDTFPLRSYEDPRDVARLLKDMVDRFNPSEWPRLPITARTTRSLELKYWFEGQVHEDTVADARYFWGRVPINLLVRFFLEYRDWSAEELYVDLGTTVRAAGSGSQFDRTCAARLKQCPTSPGSAKIGVAIVDLGKPSSNSPDDYGGRLRHVVTQQVELDDHAEKVLSVLLQRLDQPPAGGGSLLPATTVSCALVRRPGKMVAVGKDCFDQANAVEMQDAVRLLAQQLDADALPAAVNMSLGTHVGPHNGDSPFEAYVAGKLVHLPDRVLVAAAGNDGGTGVAAKRTLRANKREPLTLHTGPRCKDLLVEFWWDDSVPAGLTVEAQIFEPLPAGGRSHLGTVKIDPTLTGSTLAAAGAGLPNYLSACSLFSATCRNNLSCAAFALTSTRVPTPALEIKFGLEAATDATVNAWIVVREEQPQTAFVEGGPDGNLMVPATDPAILSVAGVESTGQVWDGSSRGPAAQYLPQTPASQGPLMAHLAALGHAGEFGTSYASPRACADLAASFINRGLFNNSKDPTDILCEAYALSRSALPPWDERVGFHQVTV